MEGTPTAMVRELSAVRLTEGVLRHGKLPQSRLRPAPVDRLRSQFVSPFKTPEDLQKCVEHRLEP